MINKTVILNNLKSQVGKNLSFTVLQWILHPVCLKNYFHEIITAPILYSIKPTETS